MTKEHKERLNKRKIAFVYLLHRMFEGNPALLVKVMEVKGLTVNDLQEWNNDYQEAVYQTIQEEDNKGVVLKDPTEVPSIKGIKEKILRRADVLITSAQDPARLAQAYKIFSEFENTDDKKEKSVLDAINDTIRPDKDKKKSEAITMVDRMKQANKLSSQPVKRGRGRPRKNPIPIMEEPLIPEQDEEDLPPAFYEQTEEED